MRWFLAGVFIGATSVIGARLALVADEPAPAPPAAEPHHATWPSGLRGKVPVASSGGSTTTVAADDGVRPEDLVRMDALVGHLYGDLPPWDDDEERQWFDEVFQEAGQSLAASKRGRLEHLDCASYPCIALLAGSGGMEDLGAAAAEFMVGMEATTWVPPTTPDGDSFIVMEQRFEDVDANDVTLLGRKLDLQMMAAFEAVPPGAEQAINPLAWPTR